MLERALDKRYINGPSPPRPTLSNIPRRTGDWKLQIDGRQGKSWLFDLTADPTEQNNLFDQRPKKAAQLNALIEAHQTDSVGSLYPYTLESTRWIDKVPNAPSDDNDEYVWWPN